MSADPGAAPAVPGRAPAPTSDAERLATVALMSVVEPSDRSLGEWVARHGAADTVAALRSATRPKSVSRAARYAELLARTDAEAVLESARRAQLRLVCPGDAEWPTQLEDLGADAPLGLWVRGSDLRLAALRSVAVVGARAASSYGGQVAAELAAELADRGWTVVSGAAYGIDAAAHRGALAGGGLTVAVLACGADVAYPRGHEALLGRIAEDGVIVSELPPNSTPTRPRFLVRNRLIAALSRGTVVVEAALRSGSLATARQARDLGRQVMGVPGPVTSSLSAGVHRLIRDEPATLVTSAATVVEEVGLIGDDLAPRPSGPARPRDQVTGAASVVLEAMPARRGVSVEALAVATGLDPDVVLRALGGLTLSGFLQRGSSGWELTAAGRGH